MKNLQAEMSRYGVRISTIAAIIGCTEKTARNKISGETEFTISEAMLVRRIAFPTLDLEYLFAPDPEED